MSNSDLSWEIVMTADVMRQWGNRCVREAHLAAERRRWYGPDSVLDAEWLENQSKRQSDGV